jgi:hypothetical protein
MPEIALSLKGARLVELCEAAGFKTVDDLVRSSQQKIESRSITAVPRSILPVHVAWCLLLAPLRHADGQ